MKTITREEVLTGALRKVVAAAEKGWNDGSGFSPYFLIGPPMRLYVAH